MNDLYKIIIMQNIDYFLLSILFVLEFTHYKWSSPRKNLTPKTIEAKIVRYSIIQTPK